MLLTCPYCNKLHNKINPLRVQRETKQGVCKECTILKNKDALNICKDLQSKYF